MQTLGHFFEPLYHTTYHYALSSNSNLQHLLHTPLPYSHFYAMLLFQHLQPHTHFTPFSLFLYSIFIFINSMCFSLVTQICYLLLPYYKPLRTCPPSRYKPLVLVVILQFVNCCQPPQLNSFVYESLCLFWIILHLKINSDLPSDNQLWHTHPKLGTWSFEWGHNTYSEGHHLQHLMFNSKNLMWT